MSAKSNIFLTGMMGTGKSTAGKIVARKLGYEFIDTDNIIEAEEHCTVRSIFEQKGEAYFRERERVVLDRMCRGNNQVIATGGGMLASETNLALAKQSGLVILLLASNEELVNRLRHSVNRPLLSGGDLLDRLRYIESARKEIYDNIEEQINTAGKIPGIVADEIVAIHKRWVSA